MSILLNKYQTPLNDEFFSDMPQETIDQFWDYVNNVPFIQKLISNDRKRACDLDRDEKGRIIVDLANPHILEDMDYFRETAIHYRRYGVYTFLRPNGNPNSEYGKWIRREIDRSLKGMVRESDGEWIPGTLYWFLNYCVMMVTEITEGTNKADRVEGFPEVWEGIYWRFHYRDQARNGGLYDKLGGKNCAELASRGKGKAHPYSQHVYTPDGIKMWGDIKIGDYLFGDDGLKTKVIDIPFNGLCEIYEITLDNDLSVTASSGHDFKVLYNNNEIILSIKELLNLNYYDYKIPIYNNGYEWHLIKSIKFTKYCMAKCVTVDNDSNCYLIGDNIITHNSFSLAAILSKSFILGDDEKARNNVKALVTAYQKEYLTKDGVLNKFLDMIDFCAEHTQFPRRRLKNSFQEMNWVMGYKDGDLGIDRGTKNSVLGVSSKDDESKLRGKRSANILIEEFGAFPRLIDLYNILIPSIKEGKYSFGQIYALGTAGDSESDFSGAQEIMYNPNGYYMYALPNVFDKVNQGRKHFVFFFPGYINRKGNYNHDGVSDVTQALKEILLDRYNIKNNSSDPNTILKSIAEIPITPAEAIIKTGVNMFPVTYLNERLLQIDSDPRTFDDTYVGELIINNSGVIEFKINGGDPIRTFPHKDNKVEGSLEIFKMPEKDKNGKVFGDRYILGADTYDDDASETMSLGSIFVLDMWTDEIVAEYTGRPLFADDFYETCRRLCLFYNGRLNYENNKKGLFAYFSRNNSLYLLTDILDFLKDKDMVKGYTIGNKTKGTQASLPVNNYGRNLLRAWLLKPTLVSVKQDDEITEVPIANLYKIKNRALIQELISFNSVGNFDRISAMLMVMLLREDKMIMYGGDLKKPSTIDRNNYVGNDEFFSAYDKLLEKESKFSKKFAI